MKHNVKEPARKITYNWERIEADNMECMNIFRTSESGAAKVQGLC
jgi:hypothetical protein